MSCLQTTLTCLVDAQIGLNCQHSVLVCCGWLFSAASGCQSSLSLKGFDSKTTALRFLAKIVFVEPETLSIIFY